MQSTRGEGGAAEGAERGTRGGRDESRGLCVLRGILWFLWRGNGLVLGREKEEEEEGYRRGTGRADISTQNDAL